MQIYAISILQKAYLDAFLKWNFQKKGKYQIFPLF